MTAAATARTKRPAALLAALALLFPTFSQSSAADFTARQLTVLFFKAEKGRTVDLSNKDLSFLDLAGIDFKGAALEGANLHGVDLTGANLSGSNLAHARLDRAGVLRTNFSGANLENASIMRPAFYPMLGFARAEAPNFSGANLKRVRITARLDGANFTNADLTGARMGPHEPRADLSSLPANVMISCDFSGATMRGADLMWAKLGFSRFIGADMRDMNLIGTDLSNTDLTGADLTGADLTDADLDGANLTNTRGLDKVRGFASLKNLDRAIR